METGKCSAQELIGSLNVCSLGSESQGATVRYPPSYNKVFNTFVSFMGIEMGSDLADERLEYVTLYDIFKMVLRIGALLEVRSS